MRRREFLSLVGGGVTGLALLGRRSAWAQEGAVPGVTGDEIRIGMSAAFHGSSAGLGAEYYRGSMALYQEVNAQGGLYGRKIRVVALDDGYEPNPAIRNTIDLVETKQVFCLSNYVGTPTLTRALPVIRKYADDGLVLVGNFTGAQPQREPPYASQVFNIRASYRQEMMTQVEQFWTAGFRRFGVFYQIDAYGRSGTDGVARGLARHGAKILAEATYRRGAKFEEDMGAAARHLKDANVEVVLCTGAYQGCAAFIRAARDLDWNVPITNVSFVGSEAMLRLLIKQGQTTGSDYTKNLITSQVVPSFDDMSLSGVVEYRQLMDKWNPTLPEDLQEPSYSVARYSFISLEGFLNAKVIVEGLRRAGKDLTRDGFRASLESLQNLDFGVGAPLSFGPDRHQGLDRVYFTTVQGGSWVAMNDWSWVARS
jgi:branched-chain amino acid transport system substrate-binding protein